MKIKYLTLLSYLISLFLCAFMFYGCGKPKAGQGGPGGDFPANAVVALVIQETLAEKIELLGTLESRDNITLVSELDTTVEEILFTEGEKVGTDNLLFRLNDERTKARLAEAEAAFKLAELSFNRSQTLLENNTISQQEYDQNEAEYYSRKAGLALSREDQDKTLISAPFDGLMGERQISSGQFVSRGQVLSTLTRINPLEIVFDVPERYLSQLKEGLKVIFIADAYPEKQFTGKVQYLAPIIDTKTRTIRAKAKIKNLNGQLKAGMFGRLNLILSENPNALIIPEACIQFQGNMTMVVAVNTEGKSEFRPVKPGKRYKGRVEILEGLAPGEWVVVEGHQKMGPGMTVIAAPESSQYGVTPGPLAPDTETEAKAS